MGTICVGREVTRFERAIEECLRECRAEVFANRELFGEDWLTICSILSDGDAGEAAAANAPGQGHEIIGRVLAAGLECASGEELKALLIYEGQRALSANGRRTY